MISKYHSDKSVHYYKLSSVGAETPETGGEDPERGDNAAAEGAGGVRGLSDQEARVLGRALPLLRGPAPRGVP